MLSCNANIAHEFTHKLEHALVNHIAEYDKNSLEYKYLHLLEQQVNASKQKIKCFGIETHERLYFQPHMYVSYKQNKLVEPMYQLQISERNAREVQEKALEYLEKTFDLNLEKYKTTELNDAVEEINKIYGSDWTNDELYQIIDNALMCVATDTAPSQYADMTATLAYEMVTMLYGDVAMRGEMNEKIEIYSNLIRQDEMSLRLRDGYENAYEIYNSGFRNADGIVLNELDEGHIEYWQSLSTRTLETMSKKEQISNPRYVATVIAIEGAEAAKPYLKDFDSVKHWMFDNFENLSENMIMEIGNALEIDVVEEYLRYTKIDYVMSNPENIHFCDSILKESFDFIGNVNYEEVEFEITR